uniref:Ciliary neurotrophic factor n=1 Tax=Oryzias melastigma TaxID=30732 RepID=A0A3B3BC97_ORYME
PGKIYPEPCAAAAKKICEYQQDFVQRHLFVFVNILKIFCLQKEQELGNLDFDDRSHQLGGLPLLSTDFDSWLQLSDWDRLHAAFLDIQAYWNILERKRVELEKEEKAHSWLRKTRISLPQRFRHIQLDLRDLMNQVSSQMRFTRRSWIRPTPAPVHLSSERGRDWDSRVEGYIALRDLNLYLTKLARDFLLLASKRHS